MLHLNSIKNPDCHEEQPGHEEKSVAGLRESLGVGAITSRSSGSERVGTRSCRTSHHTLIASVLGRIGIRSLLATRSHTLVTGILGRVGARSHRQNALVAGVIVVGGLTRLRSCLLYTSDAADE